MTLVELLIVVAILAIVAMIVVPAVLSATDEAKESQLVTDLQTLRRQVELYKMEHADRGPHLDQDDKKDTPNTVSRLTGRTDSDGRINPNGATARISRTGRRTRFATKVLRVISSSTSRPSRRERASSAGTTTSIPACSAPIRRRVVSPWILNSGPA